MNLLQTAQVLECYTLIAVDGEIGSMETFYFDAKTWAVRYLLINTGDWLSGRRVLISPVAIGEIDEEEGTIQIELTRDQIKGSPLISTDRPVSRRYEQEYYQYYHWIPYWKLDSVFDVRMPWSSITPRTIPDKITTLNRKDTPLRCAAEVRGEIIVALDGEIGHVEEFIIDTRYWVVRYLQVATRNWWPGRHVLINTGWIEAISWAERWVRLTRKAIKHAPCFDPSKLICRNYEVKLFKHYRRPVYWRIESGSD